MQVPLSEHPTSRSSATGMGLAIQKAMCLLRSLRWVWTPAFRALIDSSTMNSLYKAAYLITRSQTQAEKLVITAYRDVAKSLACDRRDSSVRLHLFAALHGALRDAGTSGPASDPERQAKDPSHYGNARELIQSQDPNLRFIIFLRHCENLSLSEIAEITGMPVNSVRSQLLRFRKCAASMFPTPRAQIVGG